MSVHVIARSRMIGDRTPHQARRVSTNAWVVSYLRGRMLTAEQAEAAIQAADSLAALEELTRRIGLTALEAMGLALYETPWEEPPFHHHRLYTGKGSRHGRRTIRQFLSDKTSQLWGYIRGTAAI